MKIAGNKALPMKDTGDTSAAMDAKLKDVANMYEKHFLREMVKAMRSTVTESDFIKSSAGEKIFREQLDQEYVEKWGDQGGIGLSKIIYDQLLDKFGEQLGLKPSADRPRGPLPLPVKTNSNFYVSAQKNPAANNSSMQMTFTRQDNPGGTSGELVSPWAGVLSKQWKLDGQNIFEVDHDNGLKSRLMFEGQPSSNLKAGDPLQPGQRLGLLSPSALNFYWTLQEKLQLGL
ncbi:MAG: rod-binding protein [Pseudobdellovibrionaceae bacterium]